MRRLDWKRLSVASLGALTIAACGGGRANDTSATSSGGATGGAGSASTSSSTPGSTSGSTSSATSGSTGGDSGLSASASTSSTSSTGGGATGAGGGAPDAGAPSPIYWGALMNGSDTYGAGFNDAPWDMNTWNKFQTDAGKKAGIIHWAVSPPWEEPFTYYTGGGGPFALVENAGALSLATMSTGSVALTDITSGKYDAQFKTWMEAAAAYKKPFFLRFDWEMNGNWYAWGTSKGGAAVSTASEYKAAWQHVHDIATAAKATNVNWVFCLNVDPTHQYTPFADLYPGDAYVDWTALDGYNWGAHTGYSWQSVTEVFQTSYDDLLAVAPSKPIILTESASDETGGSKPDWIADFLSPSQPTSLPNAFPKVRALVWFNWAITQNNNKWTWPIESSSQSQAAFAKAIGTSYYQPGGNYGSLYSSPKIPVP